MGHNTHEDVARRWVSRILTPGRDALNSANLLDWGDHIMSYGSHFEVGRVLRDRKGNPIAWLLNGNTYSVTTSRHQSEVRTAVQNTGMPVVTIPHAALDAAGIDLRTIEIVDRQSDWWTTKIVTKEHLVGTWEYEYDHSDKGGWVNSLTGEFVERTSYWGEGSTAPRTECDHEIDLPGPWKPGWNWERDSRLNELREAHKRARHGAWEEVRGIRRNTGRKTAMMSTNIAWDLVDEPDAPLGYVFEREVRRHWLGASLIRAAVPYSVRRACKACDSTGRVEEGTGMRVWAAGTGRVEASDLCEACSGRGSTQVDRRRWAYFLSGFDENETRPSYFFCELPPKVRPTTVEEALETLKPAAVKLAEQAGREVKRQGDIFAIPMPGLTLRELKQQGGRHEKRGNLLDTNHEATEVVYVGRQTYARGTIKHVPAWRRPDHRPTPLGKEWHLIQKNTVPVSA